MKSNKMIFFAALLFNSMFSFAQKTISEGTIVYDISMHAESKEPALNLSGATNTLYLKGGLSRIDMLSNVGNETTIHNSKTGDAVILKEYSGQKLMITLTRQNWIAKNKNYDDISFELHPEVKTIAGYNCKKATAKLKDGSIITVYYTPDLTLMNKEYDPIFKNLPGFPVQYELISGNLGLNYTVTKIDFSPVALAKFDIPKSGYRILPFNDN
ncbi:MAG: hypothetical protein HY305_06325 [Sphingobacteriales bacterium]|nr:hypothetical protein [Sphingobacteriales bacterium]